MKENTKTRSNRSRVMLVLVLVCVAIGASLYPVSQISRRSSLQTAAEMISSSVLLARQKAIAGDTRFGIKYDHEAFHIYREEAGGAWTLDPPENRFLLPNDVQISAGSTPQDRWIVFANNGEIEAGAQAATLKLRDIDGNRLSIRILESGQVQESSSW